MYINDSWYWANSTLRSLFSVPVGSYASLQQHGMSAVSAGPRRLEKGQCLFVVVAMPAWHLCERRWNFLRLCRAGSWQQHQRGGLHAVPLGTFNSHQGSRSSGDCVKCGAGTYSEVEGELLWFVHRA